MMHRSDGFDEFGNPESRAYDLGGGDEDRIRGERILFYTCHIPDGPVAMAELKRMMAERGLQLDMHFGPATGPSDLTAGLLAGYTQLWYLSGDRSTLSTQQVQLVADYVRRGNGLAIWADNEPFYADANLLAQALIGCRFSGNKQADRVMVPGAERSRGHFIEHQLTQGVNNLYEGITICTIEAAPGTVALLGQSHDGQFCMGCYEHDGQRIVLDSGFTKLYPDRLHRSAGLGRYLSNIAFWLAKGSRDIEYRLLTTGRREIAAVGQGVTSPAYAFDVDKAAATTCVLQWESSATLGLTLRSPDGTVAGHVSSHSPVRVGLQAYEPGTWSAEVTGVDTRGAQVPYVLRATQSTEVDPVVAAPPARLGGDAEGQVIMPFYVLCDVSGSMAGDLDQLAKGLDELHRGLLAEPLINDLVMMSVITFNDSARTLVPLAAPEDIVLPQLPAAAGLTNYSAAFQEFRRVFDADRARLKAVGHRVYRPCVYFLTDGEPTDHNYLQTYESLLTSRNNPAYPYLCVFGFRDATEATVRGLAHADAGGPHKRGRWFLAGQGHSVRETLASLVEVIGNSILQSAQSAMSGVPEVTLPTAVPGMVGGPNQA
ncbi:VWA domain-containing protein [Catellatospora sp. NPDC049111]|uniref:VWA domain-containing protein n=1 Tax=Catellatospora sp. NPDC049111 TaxID=3155271 RepID=UPI0033ED81AB